MARENKVYLRNSLVAAAAILWYVLFQSIETAVTYFRVGFFLSDNLFASIGPALIAAVLAVGAFLVAIRNDRIETYGTECVVELRKVTWPDKPEVNGATVVVSLMTMIVSVLLFGMDKGLDWVMSITLY